MFSKKKILKLLICVWGVLLIALPFLYIPKAETSDNFAGHWYVWEENVNVSGNQWISYQNVLFVTNDPLAMGQVQVNNTTSGPSNFVQTLDFSGTYTFYSHLFEQPFTVQNNLMPVATSNSRAFTTYTPIQSAHNVEIVQLSSTQIQSLISAIQNSSSYDDTNLLTQLAIIKGVLDNIDTSASSAAADIASLLNTSNSILNALNNIDDALDTISWTNVTISYLGASNDGTNFNLTQQQYTNDYKFYTDNYTISTNADCIYYLRLPIYLDYGKTFKLGRSNNSNYYNVLYVVYGRNYTDFYFIPSENRQHNNLWNGNAKFILTVSGGQVYQYTASSSNNRFFLKTLPSSDIEYWQLKAFFEQHQYYQNEYPDLEQEQSDFNDEVDDYLTEEDSLISDFQQAITNPAIAPTLPNANPSNWGNTFIQSIAFLGVVFNTLTGAANGGNAFYLMISFSLMLGMALLIIGKRTI